MKRSIIAAVGPGNVIGYQGSIPWDIPEDMKRFRELTMGDTVIMGRRTYESIGRPLRGRQNVVLTGRQISGVQTARTLDEAWGLCDGDSWVIGGAAVYEEAMQSVDELHITFVFGDYPGDTYFPRITDRFVGHAMHVTDRYVFARYVALH